MTAFGPLFLHSFIGFDLGSPAGDSTALVRVERTGDSGTAAPLRGECLRIVEITIVPSVVTYNEWMPLKIRPDPKDPRRWFDGFRTNKPARSLRGRHPATRPWRHQSRADGQQRRRHKRKHFLEALRG